jgi:hypothetical protein
MPCAILSPLSFVPLTRDNPAVIPDISVFSENSKGGAKIAP